MVCHTIVTWHVPFTLCISALVNPADLFRKDSDALQLPAGEFLFKEGDKRDVMYVLLEGVRSADPPKSCGTVSAIALITSPL